MDSPKQNDSSDFVDVSNASNLVSKSDFGSLGFVIDNGKPRFKLDEPVSTNVFSKVDLTKSEDSLDDDSNTLSFVILGKKSLDSIQASSIATYTDIQQKCMSIDYNSIISSLNSSEIQQKLTELLQENAKLKETLKQNTIAMKKQFNTLAIWQEEVMNVHKNHKQKFTETRQLIKLLKEENAELKLKLSNVNADEITDDTKEFNHSIIKKFCYSITKELGDSINLNHLQDKITSLTDELNKFKYNCAKISDDVDKYISLSSLMNIQLKENNNSTQELDIQINEPKEQNLISDPKSEEQQNHTSNESEEQNHISNKPEEQRLISNKPKEQSLKIKKCKEDDTTNNHIQVEEISELGHLLADEIKLLHSSINVNMQQISDHIISPQSHYFTQNIKQYGEMLQEVTNCFLEQIFRHTAIQKCIKECINILDACEGIKLPKESSTTVENWSLQLDQIQIYKDKLSIYQKTLHKEQLKLIEDRQCFIKIQNQFQKLFSDYNSILYELQMMSEENIKLNLMKDSISKDNYQEITELKKQKNEYEQKYNEIKTVLEQERETWSEQKKLFDSLKNSWGMELKYLMEQKEMLFSLQKEKELTCKQCQLHESNQKLLQTDKEALERNCKQLTTEADALRIQLEEKECALQRITMIKEELAKEITIQKNEMELLKMQISFNEEDFNSEKKVKEQLLLERSELQKELETAYKKVYACHHSDQE
ncbi:PREDICTED: kinesin-related protein 4-like [Polistes dominula]|uniref:Kinesin-related protein 4-like n=1 Tax=Polistes dominula TaxID=743375 RepID=A0ABM1JCZ2_POLDO|nr:PREDICTED: kinesin-related protein 4-like [Polistes dominula]XP_015190330.1 PREDICTED: kinesin-related protein 4-like [Polistes dominula]